MEPNLRYEAMKALLADKLRIVDELDVYYYRKVGYGNATSHLLRVFVPEKLRWGSMHDVINRELYKGVEHLKIESFLDRYLTEIAKQSAKRAESLGALPHWQMRRQI